jgi:hypothetical protein
VKKTIAAILKKKDEISLIGERRRALESEVRDLESDLATNFEPNWSISVIRPEHQRKSMEALGAIRIIINLENVAEWEKFRAEMLELGISIELPYYDRQKRSVPYFYLNGHIYSDGGGHCVLHDPENPRSMDFEVLSSDEEWQSILDGNVPERLLSDGIKRMLKIDEA